MEDAAEEAEEGSAAADLFPSFPFARPRALLFSTRGFASSSSSSPSLEETLPWLAKLVLDDDDGFAENAVLSLSLLPAPPSSALGPFSPSSPSSSPLPPCRRGSPLFRLDSDAAAASSARLLWGLVSLCGGDIEGNARRERYGTRIVRSLLALLRAAAAAAPPPLPAAFEEENGATERAALSAASPPSLLLRSVSLAAQAVGAWVPVAFWLGPATEMGGSGGGGGGGGGASGRGESGTSDDGAGGGEEEEGFDVGLRCGLLKLLLFGLEAASKHEEGGAAAPDEKRKEEEESGGRRWKKRRLLRAGGEVEAVAAVAVAAVAASAASSPSSSWSSPARSVLSLVSALLGASGEGELRRLDAGRRAELWLSVVASEEEEQQEAAEEEGRRGGDRRRRRPPPDETVSSRLAAACGFATTAALAAEHAPAVLEIICRVREKEKGKQEAGFFGRKRVS